MYKNEEMTLVLPWKHPMLFLWHDLANLPSKISIVFEENGEGTPSLIQRQGHVWGRDMVGRLKIQELNASWMSLLVKSFIVDKETPSYFLFSPWGHTLLLPRHVRGNVPQETNNMLCCRETGKECRGCFREEDTICQQYGSDVTYPGRQEHRCFPLWDLCFTFSLSRNPYNILKHCLLEGKMGIFLQS